MISSPGFSSCMSKPTPPADRTRNWPAYSEALRCCGSLTIWFDPAMTCKAAPTGKRGRQPDYSDAAIQTCLTMQVLFGMCRPIWSADPVFASGNRPLKASVPNKSRNYDNMDDWWVTLESSWAAALASNYSIFNRWLWWCICLLILPMYRNGSTQAHERYVRKAIATVLATMEDRRQD